ncbi:Ig-like domain-containing protein [Nocardioides dubius]
MMAGESSDIMTNLHRRRRAAAVLAAAALAAAPLVGVSGAHAAPDAPREPSSATAYPEATKGATIDWFASAYPSLSEGSVFETVTIERFEYLLKKNTGRWAFLIGGPEDAHIQDAIAHIDAVAKAEGIEKVYNFDPNLDGEALSVFDLTGYNLYSADNAGKDQFLDLGERLVTEYLSKDAETPFRLAADPARPDQRVAADHPYFFVYDAAGGASNRIVDALVTPPGDLSAPGAEAAYRADVKRVLDSASLDVDTQWDFLSTEHNRRHFERYVRNADPAVEASNRKRFGGDIFEAERDLAGGDEDDFRIQNITYPELIEILDSDGDFVLLFGGTWCHNTAAIIQQTAQYAREHGIKKVYNFDFSLDSTGNGGTLDKHIRDNAFRAISSVQQQTRPAHLYGEILERLANAQTQYRILDTETGIQSVSPVRYYEDGVVPNPSDLAEGQKLARKIQVGHVLSYNRAGDAPVLDQAIRSDWTNPEAGNPPAPQYAGNVEYMTEWWFTAGHDASFDAADADHLRGSVNVTQVSGQNVLQNQRNFAREGLREIRDVIAGVAGGYESSVTASGLPTSVGAGEATPLTAQIDVTSLFGGYYSDRTASAQTAPLTGTRPLTGTVSISVDDEQVAEVEIDADRSTTVTGEIPALSAGSHRIGYAYSGGNGGLVAGAEASHDLQVVAESATVTLSAPASLTYGAGGTATATVTEGATGTATLNGLPGGPLEADLDQGTATFAIPASLAAGDYVLTAGYAGDDTYASATSSASALTVAKGLTVSSSSSVSTTFGKAGTLTVRVNSPSEAVTGDVRLSGVGTAQTKALSGGAVTFALPKTLAVKKYSASIDYLGSANLRPSKSQVSYTVAKGAVSKVTFTRTKTPTSKKSGGALVKVSVGSGLPSATGTIKLVIKKGATTRTVTKKLSKGSASVALPKLTRGTWTVSTQYLGSTTYASAKAKTVKLKVVR